MTAQPIGLDDISPSLSGMDFSSIEQPGVIEALDGLRDGGRRVAKVPYGQGHAYAVLGYEAVERAFRNEAELPAATFFQTFTKALMGEVVSAQFGEAHRFHRGVFQRPLMAGRVRPLVESVLRPVGDALIDAFGADREVNFVERYAVPYPFNVVSAMMGVPVEDWDSVRRDVGLLFHIWDPECGPARDRVAAYLRRLIAERRAKPGQDLVSEFAETELRGRRFTDDELLDEVRFVYPAAGGNTQNALAMTLWHVLANPALLQAVKDDPGTRAAVVDEALRITPPVPFIIRFVDRPVTIEGAAVPAGSLVLLCISSANRDPARFPEPLRFRLDRGAMQHISFGRGLHTCLGTHLANAEVKMMLDLVVTRLAGLRLADGPRQAFVGGPLHGPKTMRIRFDDVRPG